MRWPPRMPCADAPSRPRFREDRRQLLRRAFHRHERFDRVAPTEVMRGLLVRAESRLIDIDLIQPEMRRLVIEAQDIETPVPGFADGVAVIVLARADERVHLFRLHLDVDPYHEHDALLGFG